MSGQHIVEVSASSTTRDVIGAIVSSAAPPRPVAPSSNRWFQIALVFIIAFGAVVYFREEIYTFTKDVSKHPILSGEESVQIKTFIGSNWLFGSGKDVETYDRVVLPLDNKPDNKPEVLLPDNKPDSKPEVAKAFVEDEVKAGGQQGGIATKAAGQQVGIATKAAGQQGGIATKAAGQQGVEDGSKVTELLGKGDGAKAAAAA